MFKKTGTDGVVDPAINRRGRPKSQPRKTRRDVKDQELISLLRKIKPHLSDSIVTAAKIMRNDQATDSNRLKASVILLNAYKELIDDVYNGEDPEEEVQNEKDAPEVQPKSGPIFSLKVIGQESDKE